MINTRRSLMQFVAGATLITTSASTLAQAQAYPSRPARIVVGFPAGGVADIKARLMGQWLSNRFGQPFIVDNRSGASGNIATEAVAKAAPDGYTLLQIAFPHVVNPTLFPNLSFDFMRDILPVMQVARLTYVVVVNPSLPATTISELITHAKANPDKISYGSAGSGTAQHLAAEQFKMMAGINLLHVPYRGGAPAMADLLAGHIQIVFSPVSEAIEHIRSGRLRPLGATTTSRLDVLPDVPTVAEFIPGYEVNGFAGIGIPRDTPKGIVEVLNRELNASLSNPEIRAKIIELGGAPAGGTPEEFEAMLRSAIENWARVIRFAGIKAD